MSKTPSGVYTRQLTSKDHGYPLWIPEPNENLPVEYKLKGTSIGDLGVINSRGGFDFLFNITRPADDPVNINGVPQGFSPVVVKHKDISRIGNILPPGSFVGSSSFRKHSISAETSSQGTPYACTDCCLSKLTSILT
jgi:hypothetical protein